ncbi:MAG: metallophosphoesterase [Pyrinomonadaceae bacterium]
MKKYTVFRIIASSVILLILLLLVWSFFIEPNRLTANHITLEIPNWSTRLDGLRVVAVSDIHAGSPFINEAKLDELVERVNAEQPDVVVLLGDFIIQNISGGKYMPPDVIAKHLGNLHARYGVFAVLGNHDWWGDGKSVLNELNKAGIRVLEDEFAQVEIKNQKLRIIGVPDLWTQNRKNKDALRQIAAPENNATNVPLIAITHNPDVFDEMPARVSLTLAGHTHGGQVYLPFIGRPFIPSRFKQRYAIGHIVENGRHLFVTPGIGTSIIPLRFRVPPEISVLTLHSATLPTANTSENELR